MESAAGLKRTVSPAFAGVEQVKDQRKACLERFERWAAGGGRFHGSHYGWWTFPRDRDSSGQGARWTACAGDVAGLKRDERFLRDYRHGAELFMASWDCDLDAQAPLPDPSRGRRWQHHPRTDLIGEPEPR